MEKLSKDPPMLITYNNGISTTEILPWYDPKNIKHIISANYCSG